jgi:hypothetical protein
VAKHNRWGYWLLEILDPRAEFLRGREDGGQFGEVGLIDALLEKVGVANRWCFEVGADDGEFISNTRHLRDAGWDAVLVEADDTKFAALAKHATEKVRCVRQKVAGDDLDRILKRHGAPHDLDLGVIDIDGDDWHLWDATRTFRPRVMLVEYNRDRDNPPAPMGAAVAQQAGLTAVLALGAAKGYVALARTNVNVLFALDGLI